MEAVEILDLKIHRVNISNVIDKIIDSIKNSNKLKIFNLNVHAFCISFKDVDFKNAINKAEVVFCDGFGVKLGARLLGKTLGERMTPPDWIDNLCEALIANNYSLYFLGDEIGVADKCADILLKKHPALIIKGTHHGFFEKKGKENEDVIEIINHLKPDVLLVGLGMPLQEKWIINNHTKLDATVYISVGAMFRWISGVEKRAPKLLSSNGFEGFWRLITQPQKVWKRYVVEVPYFFLKIFKHAFFKNIK